MHLEQMFVDGNDAYVWIYDHTPWYYWILSVMVVVGAVALCLFPLWPSAFRSAPLSHSSSFLWIAFASRESNNFAESV